MIEIHEVEECEDTCVQRILDECVKNCDELLRKSSEWVEDHENAENICNDKFKDECNFTE